MHLFGLDFSTFFQPLLALCGALALVLNTRNQDLARLIRSGTEQVTRRENGEAVIDENRRLALRKQAVVFHERILIVQTGLLLTYFAGISLTLMACFTKFPLRFPVPLAGLFGLIGVLFVILACASAVRDIAKSVDTIELEMVSAYGPDILPHRADLLNRLLNPQKRSLWVRLAESIQAFGQTFQEEKRPPEQEGTSSPAPPNLP